MMFCLFLQGSSKFKPNEYPLPHFHTPNTQSRYQTPFHTYLLHTYTQAQNSTPTNKHQSRTPPPKHLPPNNLQLKTTRNILPTASLPTEGKIFYKI